MKMSVYSLNLIVEHIIYAYLCSPVSSFYIYIFLSIATILSIFYFNILVLVPMGIVLYARTEPGFLFIPG